LFGSCTTTQADSPPRFVYLQRYSGVVVRITNTVAREKEGWNMRRERERER